MIIMRKDRRKELERKVDESLEEIRVKGCTKERNEEYQRRQTEWWKECDKFSIGLKDL
jgi:hypothetical protein